MDNSTSVLHRLVINKILVYNLLTNQPLSSSPSLCYPAILSFSHLLLSLSFPTPLSLLLCFFCLSLSLLLSRILLLALSLALSLSFLPPQNSNHIQQHPHATLPFQSRRPILTKLTPPPYPHPTHLHAPHARTNTNKPYRNT